MTRTAYAVLPPALVLFVLSLYTSVVILEGIPHSQDEVVYLFQARILRAGVLYLPSLPEGVREFFDHEFVVNDGKWYGKYSPGTSLLLLTGLNAGAPWLVNPLLGALSVVLLYLLARRFLGRSTALVAAYLFALSPFAILMSASYLGHAPALFFTLLFFLSLLSGVTTRRPERAARWSLLGGVALGAIFLIRPYNVLPLALFAAAYCFTLLLSGRRGRQRYLAPALFVLPAALLAVANFGYNLALTGEPLKFPHQAYSAYDFIGFGKRGVEWGRDFGPQDAIKNLSRNYQALARGLFAWPGFALVAAAPLAFLSRVRRVALFLLPLFLLQVALYGIYFHPGTFYGPRYWYEASWVLVLLTAKGIVVLFGVVRRGVGRRYANLLLTFALGLTIAMSLLSDATLLPQYKGYNRMTRVSAPRVARPAIVFVPADAVWQTYGRYFALQSPFLEQQAIIFARDEARHNVWKSRPPLDNEALLEHFPDRNVRVLGR